MNLFFTMSFTNIHNFLTEVRDYAEANEISNEESFATLLKTKHYWPALQWKKFHDRSGLILLHNTYKRTDVGAFEDLYNECRSVVLDLHAPPGENIVVTLANPIPTRFVETQYEDLMLYNDICNVSYEGTVITVYEYGGRWYFGTSSCPSVDTSRYFHPTKRHGTMFDEVLQEMFPDVVLQTEEKEPVSSETLTNAQKAHRETLRSRFTSLLNPSKAYFFILVHHENQHIMDYTEDFGAKYKKLIHIMTRDKMSKQEDSLHEPAFAPYSSNILYSQQFESPIIAMEWLKAHPQSYGIMVKRNDGKLLKISNSQINYREEEDLGNPNPWMNMLWVYVQNKPHYHVNDYIKKYCPNIAYPVDQYGRTLAPVYMIHTVICTMRDCLYQCYRYTTRYYPQYNRWKMNKVLDEELPKIIRFHLSQLRNIQVTTHANEYITPHSIYHYICHHQTMQNLIKLIGFFADTRENTFNMSTKTIECFQILYGLLTKRSV